MPTYKVTHPTTGKTVSITGETAPTEQELNDIFSKTGVASQTAPPAVTSSEDTVPEWGRKHPNLYGVYGAGRALAREGIKGAASAAGMAAGALIPVPGGTLVGGGTGYALGAEATRKLGLEEEPAQDRTWGQAAAEFGGNVALGALYSGVGKAMGIGGKAGLQYLERQFPAAYAALTKHAPQVINAVRQGGMSPRELRTQLSNLTASAYPKVPGLSVQDRGLLADINRASARVDLRTQSPSAKKQFEMNKFMPIRTGEASTPAALQELRNTREWGFDLIGQMRDKIILTRKGQQLRGQLPENLQELTEAIPQAKSEIWRMTSAIEDAAEQGGLRVPLAGTVSALEKFSSLKDVKVLRPELVNKASALKTRLLQEHPSGDMSPSEARNYVKGLNDLLSEYYKKGQFSGSDLDTLKALAVAANNLRGSMTTVMNQVSPEYANLRKAYGALDSIEPGAVRAEIKSTAGKAAKHMSWLDIVAAEEAVGAGLSEHPSASLTRAGTAKVLSSMRKPAPDKAVKRLFQAVEKSKQGRLSEPEIRPITPTEPMIKDPSTGRMVPARQTATPRTELGLRGGEPPATVIDPSTGRPVLRQQQAAQRTPLNLPVGQPAYTPPPRIPLNLPVGQPAYTPPPRIPSAQVATPERSMAQLAPPRTTKQRSMSLKKVAEQFGLTDEEAVRILEDVVLKGSQ